MMAFNWTVIARSEATKQSRVALNYPGLLRFARNDELAETKVIIA
jgi:hypothetical protein